jgi:hypothetical protein
MLEKYPEHGYCYFLLDFPHFSPFVFRNNKKGILLRYNKLLYIIYTHVKLKSEDQGQGGENQLDV